MTATAIKKAAISSSCPAAAVFFEQLAGLFASTPAKRKAAVETKQLDASLKALQQAPVDEIAAVSQVLEEIAASLDKAREHAKVKSPFTAESAAKSEDAMVRGVLARAREAEVDAAPTAEQARANAEVVSTLRQASAAALQRRIDSKELLPPKQFQDALGISRQSINEAVKARRMFALLGPAGEYYYPAFYADGDLDRRAVEKVAKALGGTPAASKYHFFTSKSTYLGTVTPLHALKQGRLDEVLIAAAGYAER